MHSQLGLQRQLNQCINGMKFEQPEEVVRWMGAMQAQDYGQAVWAIGLRTQSATLTGVERAIAEGKILRTWPMRGTIHFVPAQDAKWMVRLSAQRMIASGRRRREGLGLDETTLERGKQLFFDALNGGRRLTRAAMFTLLENAGIPPANQRGYHVLGYAALTGLICIGPMQGKQQTFVLLDEWAPGPRDFSGEEALAELARRYFASHGPATLYDFAWWAGLPLKDARLGAAAARPALSSAVAGEKEYWWAGDLPEQATADQPEDVQLLPGFDEYLLGYTDRSDVLDGGHAQKVVPGNNGMFRPMVVVNGQVSGAWKRTVKKKALEITLEPFTPLAAAEETIRAAAQRYSRFLELPLSSLSIEASAVK